MVVVVLLGCHTVDQVSSGCVLHAGVEGSLFSWRWVCVVVVPLPGGLIDLFPDYRWSALWQLVLCSGTDLVYSTLDVYWGLIDVMLAPSSGWIHLGRCIASAIRTGIT